MALIDKNGKIFEKINIIDVLIIIILIAGIYAGYMFIFGETNETYLTIITDNQPSWIYKNINVGDKEYGYFTGRVMGEVTGIQIFPSLAKNKTLLVTMNVKASKKNGVLYYKDEIIKIGKSIDVTTEKIIFSGTIINISRNSQLPQISDEPKIVKLRAEGVPASTVQELTAGLAFNENNQKILEITDLEKIPTGYNYYTIVMKALVNSKRFDNQLLFNNTELKKENSLQIANDKISFSAQILDIESPLEENKLLEPVEATKIVDLVVGNVSTETLGKIKTNVAETTKDGLQLLKIVDLKKTYLSETVAKVRALVELKTERFNDKILYKNNPLIIGSGITMDLPEASISGTIFGIYDSVSQVPTATIVETKTVKLLAKNVNPWIADEIFAGDTEIDQGTGKPTVKILKKTISPAEIITTSQDGKILKQFHPTNKDIEIEAELVVEKDIYGRLLFKGDIIEADSAISLNFLKTTISAIVIEIEDG